MSDYERERRARRREASDGPFDRLCAGFLSLPGWGYDVPVVRRLKAARAALREYRDAHGQERDMGDGELILAVRTVADQLASDIHTAAGAGHDPATIAWVLAGLRCPAQPFCSGCPACFTVTCPSRPCGKDVLEPTT